MNYSLKRRAKIVATLGPASSTLPVIEGLIEDGLDIVRLNFSHGTHADHERRITLVREAAKRAGRPIAILQDLQGPKLRAGVLPPAGIELKVGDVLLLYPEGQTPKLSTHGRKAIPISAEIALSVSQDATTGSRVLFDDGKISTRVSQVSPPELVVEVEVGGLLKSNKGMNLPGTPLSIPCLTEKDLEDLKFGLSQGVDAVALSFVRSAQDIEDLRREMAKVTQDPPLVIPKIERVEAIAEKDSIIEVSDGLLIARGDMAVEIGAEYVPTVQKDLIHACNALGVPVITATQMLESMISSPTPTRAEASDVANAVFDGTDAVMLSAETASGDYPRDSVRTMARIILEAERNEAAHSRHRDALPLPGSVVDAIASSAAAISEQVGAQAIACMTHSGMAARVLAKYRPDAPIIAITANEAVARKLVLPWGVHPIVIPKIVATDDLFAMVERLLQDHSWVKPQDLIVVTAGVPALRRGTTNTLKVHRVGVVSDRSLLPSETL